MALRVLIYSNYHQRKTLEGMRKPDLYGFLYESCTGRSNISACPYFSLKKQRQLCLRQLHRQ